VSQWQTRPVLLCCAALAASIFSTAQSPRSEAQMNRDMEQRQIKAMNLQRQQEIRSDTDRLFQLATELKAAVDKSNENTLSLDVVRKADEVEKLAKRVKEKMKEGVGSTPHVDIPPPPHFPGHRPH
jgi:septal ring factor EnvC (AmiA/AmiB activator)